MKKTKHRNKKTTQHENKPKGLKRSVWAALDAGKGSFRRYAESGQVMVDRGRHLDVLEWAWFLNAFGEGHVYRHMYGDKVI